MIERFLLWLFGSMVADSQYRDQANDKKVGMLVAGVTFTLHMVIHQPEGWEMWATYMGAVGGWNVGTYAFKKMAESRAAKLNQEENDANKNHP